MDIIKRRLVYIHSCRGVGWKSIYKFIEFDSSLQTIFTLKEHDFINLFQMTKTHSKIFYEDLHRQCTNGYIEQLQKENIMILTILDKDYPDDLKHIYDPPWVLYLKGKKTLLKSKCVSIVGTRAPSKYGYNVMRTIIPPLVQNKWTIVSGLAKGIDTCAHQIAIQEKGNTIAVLGSGFYHIYPFENKSLANYMSTNHLLLSEFPPNKKAEKWHFPFRNRIISGLSKGTVVIEAKERSGSLITAEQALEQGRDVFAIPGSIFGQTNQGTNRLIQQGAKLVLNAMDIIEDLK